MVRHRAGDRADAVGVGGARPGYRSPMSDIEFDDPETATEELRNAAATPSEEDTPDANVTGFDDDAVSIERDPADRADADDRHVEAPDDDMSPGVDLTQGAWGSVEPNEPA